MIGARQQIYNRLRELSDMDWPEPKEQAMNKVRSPMRTDPISKKRHTKHTPNNTHHMPEGEQTSKIQPNTPNKN